VKGGLLVGKLKLDLRKTLRAIAVDVQDAIVSRLVSGSSVSGEELAPQKEREHAQAIGRRKRVRVLGVRIALAGLAGKVGIKTGELLKGLQRRSNIRIGRVSFKIVPPAEVLARWNVLNKGDARQVARPVGGITGEQLDRAAEELTIAARDQFAASLRDRD
jgi:hypothetical protein